MVVVNTSSDATAAAATAGIVENMKTFDIGFPQGALQGIRVGASVAVNGTCLTVVDRPKENVARFDVIEETLRRTNLGMLMESSEVNFERSARVGDEIGGHTVSGHVQTVATIVDVKQDGGDVRFEFDLEAGEARERWMRYILPKGFVAVDGCSLTVGEVSDTGFCVYLIPETLRVTVLGDKGVGDAVNIEVEAQTQAIVDTVERVMARYMAKEG